METKMSNVSVKKMWSMEYSKNLKITRRESKMNDWLKVFLIKSKIGQRYTAPIYPALSIQSISLNNAKIQNSRKIQYSRKICVDHFFYYNGVRLYLSCVSSCNYLFFLLQNVSISNKTLPEGCGPRNPQKTLSQGQGLRQLHFTFCVNWGGEQNFNMIVEKDLGEQGKDKERQRRGGFVGPRF